VTPETQYSFINERLTKSEFRENISSLLASMHQSASRLPEKEKAERKKKAGKDFFYFAKTYFPHYCSLPFADYHREAYHKIMHKKAIVVEPTVILGPREYAKSVVFRLLLAAWIVAFKKYHFGAYAAANESMAGDHLFYLALEFAANDRLIQDFGELCPRNYQGSSVIFTNNVKWIAISRGSATKGLIHGPYRLEVAVCDDIEKGKEAKSPKVVNETLRWLEQDLYNAIAKNGLMIILGNNSERNCAMDKIKKNYGNRWLVLVYTPYADKAKTISLWPEKRSIEELDAVKHVMGLKAWMGDMMQEPLSASDTFQERWIIRKDPEKKYALYISATDPAVGENAEDCSKANVVIGITDDGMIDVLYSWIRKESISAMLSDLFATNSRYEMTEMVLEQNGSQKFLFLEIGRMEAERGVRLPIRGITNSDSKPSRIESLSPLIERGVLRFCHGSDNEVLIEQILSYPNGEKDGPDALATAVKRQRKSARKAKAHAG